MRLLEKYIIKSILKAFLIALFIFAGLFVLIDTAGHLDEFIAREVPITIILQYYLYYLPNILTQTASIGFLISVLLIFSHLNNDNEIIVMRSSGMNFWRIIKPALFLSILVAVLVFWTNEKFIPISTEKQKDIKITHLAVKEKRKTKKGKIIKNLTFYGLKNRLYFIDSFASKSKELNGITILEYDNQQLLTQKIVALNGQWTGIAWKFYKCQITTYSKKGITDPLKIRIYDEKIMDIKETPVDFLRQRLDVRTMNMINLGQYIDRFSNSGAIKALKKLRVDYYQKVAQPFSIIIIVLIGIPLTLMTHNRKGTTFSSMGIAVAIGFLYYVSTAITLALGKAGVLSPLLSVWLTPILFIIIAITIIKLDFSN